MLDTSFGADGIASVPASYKNLIWALAIDSHGRIVAGGFSDTATHDDFMVARFLPDGQLDPSFGGGDGIVATMVSAADDLALGPGDEIIVGCLEPPPTPRALTVDRHGDTRMGVSSWNRTAGLRQCDPAYAGAAAESIGPAKGRARSCL